VREAVRSDVALPRAKLEAVLRALRGTEAHVMRLAEERWKMLAAGLSRYTPDPMTALKAAACANMNFVAPFWSASVKNLKPSAMLSGRKSKQRR
jgi:hypothetical protein